MQENRVAIIVGAGAVENAWQPVLKALNILYRNEVDKDIANCIFARCIYLLRFYSKFPGKGTLENLKLEIENVSILKKIVCEQLSQAQNEGIIKPRKEFSKILDKFVFNNFNNIFGIISTNWDTVIDKEADRLVKNVYKNISSAKCFHIHGSVEISEKIYLPSETTQENYRSKEENDKYGFDHYSTMKFLSEANQIILYGLSLDPLDAELSQVLNTSCVISQNLREVIIIDPNYKQIKKRMEFLLLPITHIVIRGYYPENLTK